MRMEQKIVYQGGEAEIVEKKSRFIANVMPIESEEEALAYLESIRKKHWNARHHCFAYVIGERNELARCSDDGEPQGTAGKPMLDVIFGAEVHNVIVVVTRYFGGTLLGTGGLVRAYSLATKEGLASTTIITKIWGVNLKIGTDYTGLGKIQYILGQRGIQIINTEYTDVVSMEALISSEEIQAVQAEIIEGTNGKAELEITKECYFAQIDGKNQII